MKLHLRNHQDVVLAEILFLALCLAVAPFPGIARADQTNSVTTTVAVVTNVQVDVAAKLVIEGKVIVLDVRTPTEFAEGHIAGATNINFMAKDFAAQVGQLDRDKVYLVHCASGGRSKRCLPQLKQLGFRQIYHLDGGFAAWEEAGKPAAKN